MTTTAYSYIRFSTPEQQKGDSLRRQLEKSQAYATEHGLIIDETLNMRDLGVSAFRKANIEKGNLGAFIKAIDTGLVKPGSYLIVESLDRLSRAEVLDALKVFLDILDKDIVIVTLVDKRTYSRESLRENAMELIVSIAVMVRSHDESLTKSVRRRASWEQAKKLAVQSGKKITRKIPFWLSLPDKAGEFKVKEDEAATVRLIFDLAKKGLGYLKISQELNKRGINPPATRTYAKDKHEDCGWGTSSVAHVLASEAVIGNLIVDKKSDSPQTIRDYYPSIIEEALFYEVRPKVGARGGRASPFKTNLFTHRLFCGYCGSAMQVDAGKKNGIRRSNMICQSGRRGFGCTAKAWHYEEFEEAFFRFVQEVDASTLIGRKTGNVVLEQAITELRGRINANESKITSVLNAIEEGNAPSRLVSRLRELETEQVAMEVELKFKLLELDEYLHCEARLTRGVQQLRELYQQIKVAEDDERVLLRYSVAEYIASVVDSIAVFSTGTMLAKYEYGPDSPITPDLGKSFTVKFRSGILRLVKPDGNWTIKL